MFCLMCSLYFSVFVGEKKLIVFLYHTFSKPSYLLLSDWGYCGSICWAIRHWLPAFKVQQYISIWLHNINLQRAKPTNGAATFDSTHSRENKSRRSHQPLSLIVPDRLLVDIHHTPYWSLLVLSQTEGLHMALSVLKSPLVECSRLSDLWIKECSGYIEILCCALSICLIFPNWFS